MSVIKDICKNNYNNKNNEIYFVESLNIGTIYICLTTDMI